MGHISHDGPPDEAYKILYIYYACIINFYIFGNQLTLYEGGYH